MFFDLKAHFFFLSLLVLKEIKTFSMEPYKFYGPLALSVLWVSWSTRKADRPFREDLIHNNWLKVTHSLLQRLQNVYFM